MENWLVRGIIQPNISLASAPSGIAVISDVFTPTLSSKHDFVPVKGLPLIRRRSSWRVKASFKITEKGVPISASTYMGDAIALPPRAMVRRRFTLPVLKSLPKKITNVGSTVQTSSPLFTGEIWFTCTPTFPAGHGPSKTVTSTSFAFTNASAFWFFPIPK